MLQKDTYSLTGCAGNIVKHSHGGKFWLHSCECCMLSGDMMVTSLSVLWCGASILRPVTQEYIFIAD